MINNESKPAKSVSGPNESKIDQIESESADGSFFNSPQAPLCWSTGALAKSPSGGGLGSVGRSSPRCVAGLAGPLSPLCDGDGAQWCSIISRVLENRTATEIESLNHGATAFIRSMLALYLSQIVCLKLPT